LSVATELAPNRHTIGAIGNRVLEESSAKLPVSYIERITGVQTVYHRDEHQQASDLAVAAARTALDRAGLRVDDIDLLIFASASQDLIEPATSHIVAASLGATGTPVMDVKNACNSFLNGIQVANAFIVAGLYRRILIVSGETPSMAIRWANTSKDQFMRSFPGFSMTDTGGAMILVADREVAGVHAVEFRSDSAKWDVGTLGMGGSRAPRDLNATYFDMDGRKLHDAFLSLGPTLLDETLDRTGHRWSDFAAIGMHQVAAPYLDTICRVLGVPESQVVKTIADYGNTTSCSLPLQLELSIANKTISEGDEFAFIGFGGGISLGLGVFTL
jgi:3-oxoacyl-[acyl-carrier-protein] synthase-3